MWLAWARTVCTCGRMSFQRSASCGRLRQPSACVSNTWPPHVPHVNPATCVCSSLVHVSFTCPLWRVCRLFGPKYLTPPVNSPSCDRGPIGVASTMYWRCQPVSRSPLAASPRLKLLCVGARMGTRRRRGSMEHSLRSHFGSSHFGSRAVGPEPRPARGRRAGPSS